MVGRILATRCHIAHGSQFLLGSRYFLRPCVPSKLLEIGQVLKCCRRLSLVSAYRPATCVHRSRSSQFLWHNDCLPRSPPTELRHTSNEVWSVVFFFRRCLYNRGFWGASAAHHGSGKAIKTLWPAVCSFMGVDVMQVFHEAESVTSHRTDCVYQAVSTTGKLLTEETSYVCLEVHDKNVLEACRLLPCMKQNWIQKALYTIQGVYISRLHLSNSVWYSESHL